MDIFQQFDINVGEVYKDLVENFFNCIHIKSY